MAWHATAYTHRQKITIDGTAGNGLSGSLTNQTVAVNVPVGNSDFWTNAQDINDVRFTSSDETTDINYQIESFDHTGDDAWYHVQIPTLGTGDTDIYMYYGKVGDSDGSSVAGTWSSEYVQVLHLNGDQTEGEMDDAIGNADGTNGGTTDRVMQVDKGRDFDGVNDGITFGNGTIAALLNGAGGATFECVVEVDTLDGDAQLIFNVVIDGTKTGNSFQVRATTDVFRIAGRSQGSDTNQTADSAATSNTGAKDFFIVKYNYAGDTVTVKRNDTAIINAVSVTFGSATYVDANNQSLTDSMGQSSSTLFLDGGVDEFCVRSEHTSNDYDTARYQSQLRTWLTFAAQEAMPAAGIVPFRRRIEGY